MRKWALAGMVLAMVSQAAGALPKALLLIPELDDAGLATELGDMVEGAGYQVERKDARDLTSEADLECDFLVLVNARRLPMRVAGPIERYLRSGRDMLAVGLPAWEEPLLNVGGQWKTMREYETQLALTKPERVAVDWESAALAHWQPVSDQPSSPSSYEITREGNAAVLHARVPQLGRWETLHSPRLGEVFADGQSLTCFRARGGPDTTEMMVEWEARDGSRWIATIELEPKWRNYALRPEQFQAWPAEAGVGKKFDPRGAEKLVLGLARSHNSLHGERHEYWISSVGVAANSLAESAAESDLTPPPLPSISPNFQFYPISTQCVVRAIGGEEDHAMEKGALIAMHPRVRGVGLGQERAYRWEPLIEARDKATGEERGVVAALLMWEGPPYRRGVWAAFTPHEAKFYRQPAMRACLQDTLIRLKRGLFLIEAGAEKFTVFDGEMVHLGAKIRNRGSEPIRDVEVRVRALDGESEGFSLRHDQDSLLPGESVSMSKPWRPTSWPQTGWRIASELFVAGQRVDRIEHELHVWRPQPEKRFVEVRDGQMIGNGKPLRLHGVNYMPASGIGLMDQQLFEHWLGKGAYDPEVIRRDLGRVKAMNMNAVSVFLYHESLESGHLLDFLRTCRECGLWVNLSLRPGTPMDFRWEEMRELIEHYRLAENDTVMAYDLAWEPNHGNEQQQEQAYGTRWREWVRKRHGDLQGARKAWQQEGEFELQADRLEDLKVPAMDWIVNDGPWRRMAADYQRFLDSLLAENYGRARDLVKSVDPHHLASFRMSEAGTVRERNVGFLAYDFRGLAEAVDLWEPEAYGLLGDWERVKLGRFTADYARLCNPRLPVVWAEAGSSVWDRQRMRPNPHAQRGQARFFEDFYRMLDESEADGVFFWWYPGGYRYNEQSDYGLVNPDGTDRPVTKVVREKGREFLAKTGHKSKVESWIPVRRDEDVRGLFRIYESVREAYWDAIDAGKRPGLRWSE